MPDSASDSETLTVHLAHRAARYRDYEGSGDNLVTTVIDHFTLTPVTVRRPTTGFRRLTTVVRCEECDKELRCVCYSPRRTQWRRRRRKVLGWSTLLLAAAVWSFTIVRSVQNGSAPIRPGLGLLVFLSVMCIFLVVVGITVAREDAGDLSVRLRADRLHSLRGAGSVSEVNTHESPPLPL